MEISQADYKLLWQPWRKALIIKVFRRNISYKLLVQRIKDIWKLDWDCEITDLEGYYLVRFRSKKDYDRVLNMGHGWCSDIT